jgi:hypothetical protein
MIGQSIYPFFQRSYPVILLLHLAGSYFHKGSAGAVVLIIHGTIRLKDDQEEGRCFLLFRRFSWVSSYGT